MRPSVKLRATNQSATVAIVLAIGLFLVGGAALSLGAVDVAIPSVIPILFDHLGGPTPSNVSTVDDSVVWQIRAPRLALGLLVGAGLGVSGTLLQGVFRNPLAEPSIIGVSGGASVGAICCIISGANFLGSRTVSAAAFLGALLATLLVYLLSRSAGMTNTVTLVLVGIAVGLLTQAISGLLTSVADDDQLRSIVFWSLGSLSGSTWKTVVVTSPLIIVGTALALTQSTNLDLLSLGDRQAADLGVNVDRVRGIVLCLAALLTGAAVAVAGIIGFIGLVVPHLLRLLVGPTHRMLLPLSVLGGALLIIGSDVVARLAAEPVELPLGVVTALLGGPYLIYLIRRSTNEDGWL